MELESESLGNKAQEVIKLISEVVSPPNQQIQPEIQAHFVSLAELDKLSNVTVLADKIMIDNPKGHGVCCFPIPQSNGLAHKGGLPRVLTKIVCGASSAGIKAEFPVNDIDLILEIDNSEATIEVEELKDQNYLFAAPIESSGVEYIDKICPERIFLSRDMTLNSCLLTSEGLFFSEEAARDVELGRIKTIIGRGRELFGSDSFKHQGTTLLTRASLMRFTKMLAEGKGDYFELPARNLKVDMSIYWLVLARKLSKKEGFPKLMQKAFQIGKDLNQVKPGEDSVFDTLTRIHGECPFFNFESSTLDSTGVARWLAGKLSKQVRRAFRHQHNYKLRSDIPVTSGDTRLIRISQPVHLENPISDEVFQAQWSEFLKSSSRRFERSQ